MRFEDIGITALYMALGTDWFKSSVSQAGITGSNPVGATKIRGVVKFKIRLYSLLLRMNAVD